MKTVSIIGLGYIGLPTAAVLASKKVPVVGVDINEHTVALVNAGMIPIIEPGLDTLLQQVVEDAYLRATTCPEPADVFLIAVPTPFKQGHRPDVQHIEAAARAIAPVLKRGDLVILESTSPVGATEKMAAWLAEARPDLSFPQQAGERADVCIAYCPERVLPGQILRELVENDRVIGGMTPRCSAAAKDFYSIFVQGDCYLTDARTAELCKLTENSFRDVNIAFANELSMICDTLGIDAWELIRLANRHPRVNILQPGCGVGGHCIAVDPWFIVDSTPEQARLIRTAREVNDYKPQWVVEKIKASIAEVLAQHPEKRMQDVTVACLGLAYKPDVGDVRNSPAVKIIEEIAKLGCKIVVVDPYTNEYTLLLSVGIYENRVSQDFVLQNADIVAMLVEHKIFKDKICNRINEFNCKKILFIKI